MANSKWEAAEALCFAWLRDATGDAEDVTAFLPDPGLPDAIKNVPESQFWGFETGGGDPELHINNTSNARTNRLCHGMDAELEGFFMTRSNAMEVGDLIIDALPAGGDELTGIVDFRNTAQPLVERALRPSSTSTTGGKDVQGWRLFIPFRIKYGSITYGG